METMAAIRSRHSTRLFKPDAVDRKVLEQIVDAGRLAATAINIQPWDFVVVTEAGRRQAIADMTDHGKFIAEAGACIAVFCRPTPYYLEDGAAATQAMLIAAAGLGVQTCWVSGDKRPYADAVRDLLGVPASHKLVSLIAAGYEREREGRQPKRSLGEVLHWEKF